MSFRMIVSILFLISVLILAWSSQKADYEDVQRLQDASEQVMQHSSDYDVRLKACGDKLLSQLERGFQAKVIREAQKVHSFCNVERIDQQSRNERKEGSRIVVDASYAVRMKGATLGMDIFKLDVRVSGYVATDTKLVSVDQRATVVE